MNTLVVIISHQANVEMLHRNWQWHVRSGCPILLVEHEDKPEMVIPAVFANGYAVKRLRIGTDPDKMRHRWVGRLVKVMATLLQVEKCGYWDDFCIIETDGIFPRALPAHNGGLVTTPAGHRSQGFHGSRYYHSPWWFDRKTAQDFLHWSKRMLHCDLDEGGFVDRFIGLVDDLYDLAITPAFSYSQNSLDQPEFITQAREAVERGCYYVHGIKTPQQLSEVTEGLT